MDNVSILNDPHSKRAILFPGQGSQEKGMGKSLAEISEDAVNLWKMAEKASGLPLREIFWEGTDADMADTRALQPAMTALNLGLWLHFKKNLNPAALAGHSLGEFSALGAAEVLSIADILELVSLRGRLMAQTGSNGAMAAVLKLDSATLDTLIAETVAETGGVLLAANINSPGQIVVSGTKSSVESLSERMRAAKGRLMLLPVSGAFHSPLMQEAADELLALMNKINFNAPKIPLYFNVTATTEENPEKIREIMARQMTAPVRWTEIMASMWEAGLRNFVELGPKGVLAKLLKANFLDKKTDEWEGLNISAPI